MQLTARRLLAIAAGSAAVPYVVLAAEAETCNSTLKVDPASKDGQAVTNALNALGGQGEGTPEEALNRLRGIPSNQTSLRNQCARARLLAMLGQIGKVDASCFERCEPNATQELRAALDKKEAEAALLATAGTSAAAGAAAAAAVGESLGTGGTGGTGGSTGGAGAVTGGTGGGGLGGSGAEAALIVRNGGTGGSAGTDDGVTNVPEEKPLALFAAVDWAPISPAGLAGRGGLSLKIADLYLEPGLLVAPHNLGLWADAYYGFLFANVRLGPELAGSLLFAHDDEGVPDPTLGARLSLKVLWPLTAPVALFASFGGEWYPLKHDSYASGLLAVTAGVRGSPL